MNLSMSLLIWKAKRARKTRLKLGPFLSFLTYNLRLRKKHLLRLATVKRSGLSGLDSASFKRFQGDSTRISTGKAVLILRQISISFDLLSIDY